MAGDRLVSAARMVARMPSRLYYVDGDISKGLVLF